MDAHQISTLCEKSLIIILYITVGSLRQRVGSLCFLLTHCVKFHVMRGVEVAASGHLCRVIVVITWQMGLGQPAWEWVEVGWCWLLQWRRGWDITESWELCGPCSLGGRAASSCVFNVKPMGCVWSKFNPVACHYLLQEDELFPPSFPCSSSDKVLPAPCPFDPVQLSTFLHLPALSPQ